MMTLFEELLTLSIHEAKGTFLGSSIDRLKPGLVGAILAELTLAGKIQISDNHRLQITDGSEVDEKVLNDALNSLKESEKDRKFGYWVNNLGQKTEKLRKQIVESLVQKGILTQDDDRLVWVIPSPLQAEVKASAKFLLTKRLRGIVLAQEDPQQRDIILLSLVRACGILDLVFLRDERKLADRFIYEMGISAALKYPALQTIQEIETAIAAVVEED